MKDCETNCIHMPIRIQTRSRKLENLELNSLALFLILYLFHYFGLIYKEYLSMFTFLEMNIFTISKKTVQKILKLGRGTIVLEPSGNINLKRTFKENQVFVLYLCTLKCSRGTVIPAI